MNKQIGVFSEKLVSNEMEKSIKNVVFGSFSLVYKHPFV